jgi:hypothetical protein
MLAGMGLESFSQLNRTHIRKRTDTERFKTFEEIYPSVESGAYLKG